ncbi:MAG: hypothetical protein R2939_04350 [Kofleriaceae bacterium]
MSTEVKRMFKVLSPVERNGKTYWQRLGTGFPNRDESINLYLDALPTNGKLQLREVDEDDLTAGGKRGAGSRDAPPGGGGELPF